MVKIVFCARRLPHLSLEEFQRYWRHTHGPLVRSYAGLLGIRRYVQTHTIDDAVNEALRASRGGPEPFDGVAELWWDSVDDLVRGAGSEEGRRAGAALLEDERRFIDLPRSPLWVAQEIPIVE
jgi:uncharacterized protein (TIGR02118 family)